METPSEALSLAPNLSLPMGLFLTLASKHGSFTLPVAHTLVLAGLSLFFPTGLLCFCLLVLLAVTLMHTLDEHLEKQRVAWLTWQISQSVRSRGQ